MASISIHPKIQSAPVLLKAPVPIRPPVKIPLLAQMSFAQNAAKPTPAIRSLKPSSKEIFWGLGKDWWKQLYDGYTHKYGPRVFDEGLHGGRKEKGYYRDAKSACAFASHSRRITKTPTVTFYKRMHRIACRHFDGISTLMTANMAGRFISPVDHKMACKVELIDLYLHLPKFHDLLEVEFPKHTFVLDPQIREKIINKRNELLIKNRALVPKLDQKYAKSFELTKLIMDHSKEKISRTNAYIWEKSQELGFTHPIAQLSIDPTDPAIIITRYFCTKEEVKHAVKFLFAEYDQKMKTAHSKEEKLRSIANLFQMLEWLHCFNDGQGRTDLILLSKELCAHGFNPPIFFNPFFSTVATLDDWVEYLKQSMERWRKLKTEMETPALLN